MVSRSEKEATAEGSTNLAKKPRQTSVVYLQRSKSGELLIERIAFKLPE